MPLKTAMNDLSQPPTAAAPSTLTSSPPLLAASSSPIVHPADEIALPGPLRGRRKRPHSNSTRCTNSSDSPLFSSDDVDASTEAYAAAKRRKRTYRGTWWADLATRRSRETTQPAKRTFRRNFDSGVFMGSDSTATESEDLERGRSCSQEEADRLERVVRDYAFGRATLVDLLEQSGAVVDERTGQLLWEQQQRAARLVAECVDNGQPLVDLTGFKLRAVLDTTLRPLQYLICQEKDRPLEPSLRLYLANNELTAVPSQVYVLQPLRSLSIRSNSISEIAPQIANLTQLIELNVGANRLRYLPYSILRLFRTASQRSETIHEFLTLHFRLRPNPFLLPVSRRAPTDASRQPAVQDRLMLAACSMPTYLTIHGTPLRPATPCPSRPGSCLRPAPPTRPHPEQRAPRAPSLFELCLRATREQRRTAGLLAFADMLPPPVVTGLARAEAITLAGSLACDVCAEPYVMPRAEWVEWWAGIRDNEDELVPLLRRACSWGCAESLFPEAEGAYDAEAEDLDAESEKRGDRNEADEAILPGEWRLCGWREA